MVDSEYPETLQKLVSVQWLSHTVASADIRKALCRNAWLKIWWYDMIHPASSGYKCRKHVSLGAMYHMFSKRQSHHVFPSIHFSVGILGLRLHASVA